MATPLPGSFDPSTIKEFDNLAPGPYKLAITKTSVKDAKSNPDNKVYTLEMDVQDGPFMGRKVFTSLNLVNTNKQTTDIAQRELKQIVEACGLPVLKGDLDELVGIPFLGDVIIELSKDPQYPDRNKVKKYYKCGGATVSPNVSTGPWGQ
jgi:hypothetical protein